MLVRAAARSESRLSAQPAVIDLVADKRRTDSERTMTTTTRLSLSGHRSRRDGARPHLGFGQRGMARRRA